ncbi:MULTISPECIES: hypothetical protein [Arthrobacter]|uniref:Uncharacterized protein n=1 Tax=Arthrobacter terricola TaxID=2547396 RepID=A0A4R5KJJ2_9MICC|nr:MULTISPECIES: hypothetical protein [Arthrobacter]MBT8161651.1 hypothetical protein [Arthrobacter sp. GN70]TDF95312.1 hypothetical protein E1809_12420 [Arthrobacter terricola]
MSTTTHLTARAYWLPLSALFGVTISVVAMTDPPWSVIMVAAFLLFVVIQGIHYGQIGREIQGKLATAGPGVGILGAVFGGAAVLVRSTPVAFWAGPVLGLITFAGTYLYLQRFGRFYRRSSETTS